MNKYVGILISILFVSVTSSVAEIYKYEDSEGNIAFTDDLSTVPENQRTNKEQFNFSEQRSFPDTVIDTGKVIEIYAHPDDYQMGLKLENGLPNSNNKNNCGVSGNQWAGVGKNEHTIGANIMMAKFHSLTVKLTTSGNCVTGVPWIKIDSLEIVH